MPQCLQGGFYVYFCLLKNTPSNSFGVTQSVTQNRYFTTPCKDKIMATRHPKTGKGTNWTITELNSLTIDDVGTVLNDSDGLQGTVRIKDNKPVIRWRYTYKWENKKRWYECGTYPTTKLSAIRAERDRARAMLKDGLNPTEQKKAHRIEAQEAIRATIEADAQKQQQALTIADMAKLWLANGVSRQDGNAALERKFNKDVLPQIGKIPVKDLTDIHLLKMYKVIKKRGIDGDAQRGMNRTIDATHNDICQMFKWASVRKPWRLLLAENGNPTSLIKISDVLDGNYQEERERILDHNEIKELYDRFMQLEQHYLTLSVKDRIKAIKPFDKRYQIAMWICLSTLCRIGELSMAQWQHIDLNKKTWHIPAQNTKGHKGKRQSHLIFLSDFTVKQFKQLYELTGHTDFCFPSRDQQNHLDVKAISKMIGDRQVQFKYREERLKGRNHDNSLVLANGDNGAWTPHDLRRTGATTMQRLGISLETINRCQNHVLKGEKVGRHYFHYHYEDETKTAWQKLGGYLTTLLYEDNVIPMLKHA